MIPEQIKFHSKRWSDKVTKNLKTPAFETNSALIKFKRNEDIVSEPRPTPMTMIQILKNASA